MKIETKLKLSLAVIVAVMLFIAYLPLRTNDAIRQTNVAMRTTIVREQNFDRLVSLLQAAETGQRGYIITGKESFLAPYQRAIEEIPRTLKAIDEDGLDYQEEQPKLNEIERLISLKLDELAETINLRRQKGFIAVEPIVSSERGKRYMDELSILLNSQAQRSLAKRNDLRTKMQMDSDNDLYASVGVILFNLFVLTVLMRQTIKTLRERELLAQKLQASSDSLASSVEIMKQRNAQKRTSAEMLHALTAIEAVNDSSKVFLTYCPKLFTRHSGAVYLYSDSKDGFERMAYWGEIINFPVIMAPNDCWGIKQGRDHITRSDKDLCCGHYASTQNSEHEKICLPLIAVEGEVLGLIYLEGELTDEKEEEYEQAFLGRLSKQIAMAVSNVKLREALRRQSLMDPLTGLYNRRYLDETFKRELIRAERKSAPLSIVLLDLDHFKKVNDVHGHAIGDQLLKEASGAITAHIRGSDAACRLGGEEFVLLLPECDTETAIQRAEILRVEIEKIELRQYGMTVKGISASLGVASFPGNGKSVESLLQAADRAMYQAKNTGRNRVTVANT